MSIFLIACLFVLDINMCLTQHVFYLNYLPAIICIVNADGEIQFANKKFKASLPHICNIFTYLFDNPIYVNHLLAEKQTFSGIIELKKSIRKSDDFTTPHSPMSQSIQNLLDKNHIYTNYNNLIKVNINKLNTHELNYIVIINNLTNLLQKQRDLFQLASLQNKLILSMLPRDISNTCLHEKQQVINNHRFVNILFADIVGFTSMCDKSRAKDITQMLNSLFSEFDKLTERFKVFKYETVGDAYVSTTGLFCIQESTSELIYDEDNPEKDKEKTQKIFDFGKELIRVSQRFFMLDSQEPVQIRIGINSGEISRVVGYKVPKFCLFGDTINVASRMQTSALPNSIHMTETTFKNLSPNQGIEYKGITQVKGKQDMPTSIWTYNLPSEAHFKISNRSNSF